MNNQHLYLRVLKLKAWVDFFEFVTNFALFTFKFYKVLLNFNRSFNNIFFKYYTFIIY